MKLLHSKELQRLSLRNPVHLAALGFGSGLAPKAPGTFGSLAAIPFWFLLEPLGLIGALVAIVVSFVCGIYFCDKASEDMQVHDHGAIVWDEFVGLWLTYWLMWLLVPITAIELLVGFVLFRVFDILKPWPIKWFDEKVHGGLGIMIDDIFAGLMAGLAYYGLHALI